MPVNQTHTDYDTNSSKWKKCRDFYGGSELVKAAGEVYLPKLTLQTDAEYDSYKERTVFANYFARTHDGLMGMLFRKEPDVTLPEVPAGSLQQAVMGLEADCDMQGSKIEAYAREVAAEVLLTGRAGTLIDYSKQEGRAYLAFYKAESIINWRVERINERMMLSLVVLQETVRSSDDAILAKGARSDSDADPYTETEQEQFRVVRLVPGAVEGSRIVVVEIWQRKEEKRGSKTKTYYEMTERYEPKRMDLNLTRIPFVFHNPETDDPTPDKPPLLDLADLNLSHYRVSADFYHGLHFTALPTAWVAGFPKDSQLRIGSSEAWVAENPEAQAGYLEFTGKGLGEYSDELDRLERRMAVVGARMLEAQKREAETSETLRLRQGGETSVLQHVGNVVSEQVTLCARWVAWWGSTEDNPEDFDDDSILVTLNSDFFDTRIPTTDLLNLTTAWVQGAISRETLHWNLSQGEILPPGRTMDEEAELIDAEGPKAGQPQEGDTSGNAEDGQGDGFSAAGGEDQTTGSTDDGSQN